MTGDVLSIDTASVTGEPLPRNYPSEQYGALILTGTTVKAGEAYCIVRKTGLNTEVTRGILFVEICIRISSTLKYPSRLYFYLLYTPCTAACTFESYHRLIEFEYYIPLLVDRVIYG